MSNELDPVAAETAALLTSFDDWWKTITKTLSDPDDQDVIFAAKMAYFAGNLRGIDAMSKIYRSKKEDKVA